MADLGCFVKDTAIVSEVEEILQHFAANNITDGKRFTLSDAYKILRSNGIEIDFESVGLIYSNAFDLTDGNFNSQKEVDKLTGRLFEDTLNNLSDMQPANREVVSGMVSAGKNAANKIVNIFRNAHVTDTNTKSVMKVFEDAMLKAATKIANKNVLPKQPSSPNRTFTDILSEAFGLDGMGVTNLQGGLNSAKQVFDEFRKEVNKYRTELLSKTSDQALIDQFDIYTDKIISKGYDLLLSEKDSKAVVKGALIEAGFSRDVNKNGQITKELDWRSLTNAVGDINYLREQVEKVLSAQGYTQNQIDRISESLESEYVNLRASIIDKQQKEIDRANNAAMARPAKELSRRNKIRTNSRGIDAKRLAQLYTYGLFDAVPNTYENIQNSLFGMSEIDQETFSKLKDLGRSLEYLYSLKLGDTKLEELQFKTALNSINEQIGNLLRDAESNNSKALKIARAIQAWFDASLRFVLTGLKNMAWQNPISGKIAKIVSSIQNQVTGNSTKELDAQNRKLAVAVFKDITFNGGAHYGDVSNVFINKGDLDRLVNKMSTNQIYHAVAGTLIGRVGLDGMDSRFKSSITHKYLVNNLLKILTSPTNPQRMSKSDAIKYISNNLSGSSYAEAERMARDVINKINTDAGQQILNSSNSYVTRLANDIVLGQLVSNGELTQEQLEAAYNAAYRAAGRDLGHVPNNPLSVMISGASDNIQRNIDYYKKRKDYTSAAMWTYAQMFFRNFMNPFVGGVSNWIVLSTEKSGLGVVTGLLSKYRDMRKGAGKIDLSTEAGMRDLEKTLYEEMKATNKLYRGAVGAISSTVMYATIYAALKAAFGDEEDEVLKRFNQWRNENRWLSKYTDEFTPSFMIAQAAAKDDDLVKYLLGYLNKNDNYDPVILFTDGVQLYMRGDASEGMGKMGEALGTRLNLPVPGWRMTRDVVQLHDGFFGESGGNEYYKSRSFMQGLMKHGFLETIGIKTNPEYTLDALPGVSSKSLDRLKDLGIEDISDLATKKNKLKSLKYKDSKGRNRTIFRTEDAEKIKQILQEWEYNK